MWSLGGFTQSSYIFIWAFFAPITAFIHDKSTHSLKWLYSFISLVIFSAIIDQRLSNIVTIEMSSEAVEIFFILNISIALSGVYFLLRYFIGETDKNTDEQLRLKHDALLKKTEDLSNTISFLESYKTNIDNNLIVTKTDINGTITFANSNFYKMTGFTKEEVIGSNHSIIKSPYTTNKFLENLWQTILSKKTWHGRIQNRKKDGTSYWVDATISPILNKDNEIVEFIAVRHNITQLMEHQDELTKLLYTDSLTSLPNRNALLKEINVKEKLFLTLINIDNFSQINNLYGEEFGNRVLIEFSLFLKAQIATIQHAKLYRLSGDEFVIITQGGALHNIITNAKNLLIQNAKTALLTDDQSITLSITIGISQEDNLHILTTANMALIAARKEFKNIMIYNSEHSLNQEYENNLKWIKEIKEAIIEDRITMFYQPIIDHDNSHIKKYESLIRLINKNGDVITPYHFLEIAKKAKLYKQLTKIVINKSFETFKDNDYEFSVNITIDDILDKDITDHIVNTLKKYDISKRVIFEIVESESIENFDDIEKFITMIKEFGCRISIDDFGTGYSNFEYLMRLHADYIKIDGSIIKGITHDKRSELITSVIVAFAKEMNIETIGEYVETKEINDKLIELGVNKSQGYYFSEPQASLGYNMPNDTKNS
jgi:PAS domain S-box-containing protein/diguanylate cyclase (GGDEF)-like protein